MQEALDKPLRPSAASRLLDLMMLTPLGWLTITGYRAYIRDLTRHLRDCRSVLDVGCGARSPLRHVPKHFHAEGVDAFGPAIAAAQAEQIHDDYHRQSVTDLDFPPKSFDAVIALDLIEHLAREDGLRLLEQMEQIARKRVIIFTPNGPVDQDPYDGNPWQRHLSSWTTADFLRRGYKVRGINGLRVLRGTQAHTRWWPEPFWSLVSNATQSYVYRRPRKAYQLLAVKYL